MSARPPLLSVSALLFLLSVSSSPASAGDAPVEAASATSAPCAQVDAGPSDQKAQQLPSAVLLRPYARPLRAEGGQPPYRFELKDGNLEGSGLVMSPDGRILGRPIRPGEWQFTVTVQDAAGCQRASQRYRLHVVNPASSAKRRHAHPPQPVAGLAA